MTGKQLQQLKDAVTNTGPLGEALEEAVRVAELYMRNWAVCRECGTEYVVEHVSLTPGVKVPRTLDHDCIVDTQLELEVG